MKSHTISFRIPPEDHLLLQKIRQIGGMGRARACRLAFARGLRALRNELLESEDATVADMLVRFSDPLKTGYSDAPTPSAPTRNPFGTAPHLSSENPKEPINAAPKPGISALPLLRDAEDGRNPSV